MGTTYSLADDRIQAALAAVMRAEHQPLHAAGVKVGVLLAYNPDGPAIKRHGSAARATVKVVPLKDRLTKGFDAELLIDQSECDLMRPAHLNALIDHELSHLVVVTKKEKAPKRGKNQPKAPPAVVIARDDLGRPKLKTRPGDWDAGDGFKDVVARHGDYAPEYENLRRAKAAADAAKAEGPGERAEPSALAGCEIEVSVNGETPVRLTGEQFERACDDLMEKVGAKKNVGVS